jgi:hypothetical protein
MRTYRLVLADDGRRSAKDVEFEADDFEVALWLAQKQALGRSAQLWCDGKLVHTVWETPNQLVQAEQEQMRTKHQPTSGAEEAATALRTLHPKLRPRFVENISRSDGPTC